MRSTVFAVARPWRAAAAALVGAALALSSLSCATSGLTPLNQSMPAARAALKAEYRFFYDALTDYGEWILIEPYGYVFRPNVDLDVWKPFGSGFWVPTDLYGWVWVSTEPFGWATYHYGQWLYDAYQHWVWIPGLDWAPAQVAWQSAGDYVGWAPILAPGSSYSSIPGGAFTYVATRDMASTDLPSRVVSERQMGSALAAVRPITNTAVENGVRFNRGPSFDWVERAAGPLQLSTIDDLVPPREYAGGRVGSSLAAGRPRPAAGADSLAALQRAARQSARQASTILKIGGPVPEQLPLVRPFGVPDRPAARSPRRGFRESAAPPDSGR